MSGSLFTDRYTDPAGQLTVEQAEALALTLRAYSERGRSAYVVVVPPEDELGKWRRSWSALDLQDHRDLLLLCHPQRWEARGWGLEPADIARLLDQNEVHLEGGVVSGVTAALGALDHAARPVTASSSAAVLGVVGITSLLALSGVGWIVARRLRRASEERDQVAAARRSLEDAVAHLVVSAEALGLEGRTLQDKAARLRDEVRRVPTDEATYLRVARVQRLEDEVAALQSEVLARRSAAAGRPEREGGC